MLIILGLLTVMSLSSFFWLFSLITSVENGQVTRSQFDHIDQLGMRPLLYQRMNSYSRDDDRWQNIAKALSRFDGEIAFNLAEFYINKQDESLAVNRTIKLWLLQAVRLGHLKAKIVLAGIYVDNNKLSAAKKLLLPIKSDLYALTLLIKISILIGESEKIEQYTQLFHRTDLAKVNEEHLLFYQKLYKYNIINNSILDTDTDTDTDCLAEIAPFATNLDNLEYIEHLISSPKLKQLKPYLCFSPVQYISKIELDCQHNEKEAIRCNESIWEKKNSVINHRFIVVLVEKGGANVNSGILYLDSNDTEEVFFHELAHLLGFIDEYALPKNHFRCAGIQNSKFSHNIAILPRLYKGSRASVRKKILSELPWASYISNKTPLVSETNEGWKLGTIDQEINTVGAFLAESCDEKDFVAIKPLKQRTAMRYFEEKFPVLYFKMLADNPEKFLMPHYLQNVMKALKEKK
jgi:hypothetical protein